MFKGSVTSGDDAFEDYISIDVLNTFIITTFVIVIT